MWKRLKIGDIIQATDVFSWGSCPEVGYKFADRARDWIGKDIREDLAPTYRWIPEKTKKGNKIYA